MAEITITPQAKSLTVYQEPPAWGEITADPRWETKAPRERAQILNDWANDVHGYMQQSHAPEFVTPEYQKDSEQFIQDCYKEILNPLATRAGQIRDRYSRGKISKDYALRTIQGVTNPAPSTPMEDGSRMAFETAKGGAEVATGMVTGAGGAALGTLAAPVAGTAVGGIGGFLAGQTMAKSAMDSFEEYLAGKDEAFADFVHADAPYAEFVGQNAPNLLFAPGSIKGFAQAAATEGLAGVGKQAAIGGGAMLGINTAIEGAQGRAPTMEGSLSSLAMGAALGGHEARSQAEKPSPDAPIAEQMREHKASIANAQADQLAAANSPLAAEALRKTVETPPETNADTMNRAISKIKVGTPGLNPLETGPMPASEFPKAQVSAAIPIGSTVRSGVYASEGAHPQIAGNRFIENGTAKYPAVVNGRKFNIAEKHIDEIVSRPDAETVSDNAPPTTEALQTKETAPENDAYWNGLNDPATMVKQATKPDGRIVASADDLVAASPEMKAASVDEGPKIYDRLKPKADEARERLFDHLVSQPAKDGEYVTLTAGGPGSGKSSNVEAAGDAVFTYDSVLGNPATAEAKVNRLIESGRDVHIVFTARDLAEAMRGNLARGLTEKRVASASGLAEAHVKARETLQHLAKVFGQDPRVKIEVKENKTGLGRIDSSIDKLEPLDLDRSRAAAHNVLDDIANGKDPDWAHGELPAGILAAAKSEVGETAGDVERGGSALQRGRGGGSAAGSAAAQDQAGSLTDGAGSDGLPKGLSPASPEDVMASRQMVSTKNAAVNERRVAEGNSELQQADRKANAETYAQVEAEIEKNKDYAKNIVDDIRSGKSKGSTDKEQTALIHEMTTVKNQRDMEAERAGDESLSETEREASKLRWQNYENRLSEIDEATKKSGTETGRALQIRRQQIADDFTYQGLERRARASKGRGLTPEESATIKAQAEQISAHKTEIDRLQGELEAKNRTAKGDAEHESTKTSVQSSERTGKAKGATVDIAAQREKIIAGMKARLAENDSPSDLYDYVQKLHENIQREAIRRGIVLNRQQVTNRIHKILTEEVGLKLPKEFTGKEGEANTQDLISGIGRATPLTTDPAKLAKMEIRTQLSMAGKIARYMKKLAAPKTGPERAPTSAESRKLDKEGRELAKQMGIVVTDPAKQLATSLAATKTRLRNEIADLDRAIALKEPLTPKTGRAALDAEAGALKAQRDAKKAEYTEVFGDPSLTDEARLKIALGAAQRAETAWNERLSDAKKGIFSRAEPGRKVTSPELAAIKARVEATKAHVSELKANDATILAEKEAKSIAAKQKTLQNQIHEIEEKLVTGERGNRSKVSRPAHPAFESLMQERDRLREMLAESRKKPEAQAAEERMQKRLEAINTQIDSKLAKMMVGDLSSDAKGRLNRPLPNAELERARQELDAVNKQMADMRRDAKAKANPYEAALASAKTRIDTLIAEKLERLHRNDFSKSPAKATLVPDKELLEKRAAHESLKLDIQRGMEGERLKNRTPHQKFWDHFVAVERAMKLTSDVVLAKLTSAAFVREFGLTPAEEAVGDVLSKLMPRLARKAVREGGFSMEAEAKAKSAMFTAGMKDAWRNLKMKESQISLLHGKPQIAPPAWYEYMGFLHGALKAPIKRAEFERSMTKRLLAAARDGIDTSNPEVMTRMGEQSYIDANRAIFMQDNVVSTGFNAMLGMMQRSESSPNLGPAAARIGRFFLPIVKVPTNIVGEVGTGIHGLASGGARAATAYIKGVETLAPEKADAIMRQLKKGLVGNALLLTGYLAADSIGGFHRQNDKRKEHDVQPETFKLGRLTLGRWAGHSTGAMLLNVGATIRRVEDERDKNGHKKGIGEGVVAAGSGILKALPFTPVASNLTNALDTEAGFHRYINNLIVGSTVPSIVSHVARVMDTPKGKQEPTRRKTGALKETFKAALPGLRQELKKK